MKHPEDALGPLDLEVLAHHRAELDAVRQQRLAAAGGRPVEPFNPAVVLSIPGLGARVATHLLTRPDPARYALWVDAGLRPTLDGGHDTHRDHLLSAARNYTHTFQTLADQINRPDEHDPDKLDLADTLIAITTEFGRTPAREDHRDGLGHWPGAYVTVLIGGPIAAPAIVGTIDPDSAQASDHSTPAELRMALLLALGIYPFDPGGFTPDAVRAASDPRTALTRLRRELLGVPL